MRKIIAALIMFVAINANGQWSEQVSGVSTNLFSISAIDNNNVWICGAYGVVLRTTNGGTNWTSTASPNSNLTLYNICGIDANTALVTGSGTDTYVYKTTNGGANWTEVFSQVGGFINAIVKYQSSTNQCAMTGDPVGGRWSLWYSSNNGTTWDSSGLYLHQAGTETGYVNSAFEVRLYNNNYFWFGTNNGRIYRGKGVQNWISQTTTGEQNICSLYFIDSLVGYAGTYSNLLKTTNSGLNWISFHSTSDVMGIASGINASELFYVENTLIYHTINNGLNWTISYTAPTGDYNHMVKARTGNNIWAITFSGSIAKYTFTVGINPISTEIPSKYSLSQNYPNPFNPSTKIKFNVVRLGDVKIVIYDVEGREVQTLVNERLSEGTYETTFDGSMQTSGVYFYKLITEGFTETKKMLLIK